MSRSSWHDGLTFLLDQDQEQLIVDGNGNADTSGTIRIPHLRSCSASFNWSWRAEGGGEDGDIMVNDSYERKG